MRILSSLQITSASTPRATALSCVGIYKTQVSGGELLVVVGSVGAGKSSLLSAVLGEMQLQQVRPACACSRGDVYTRCTSGLVAAQDIGPLRMLPEAACAAHVGAPRLLKEAAHCWGALQADGAHTQGELKVRGRCSYTAQDAWIQNASLRDNVLMGQPWDRTRYRAVIAACALQPDIDLLAAGIAE